MRSIADSGANELQTSYNVSSMSAASLVSIDR